MELIVDLKERSYPIIIEKGLIDKISEKVKNVYKGKKIFILTDENVNKYYGKKVVSALSEYFDVKLVSLKAGEETKNFNTLPMVYNELLDFNLTRSDLIITLGGGVIGDLGGFVASSYLRGIDFIQVPTSLLAQVDSSVGGKVAVDLERGKNLVGSFYHPKAVLIDPEVLNTLDNRFFIDGMAEVIKYGCIKDKMFFEFLYEMENNSDVIDNMERVIHKCCDIKRIVVESDEKDKGERMLLNFGHTLGHAIEQYYNYTKYTHGEAVAIGMYEITKISEAKGLTVKGTAERIKEILIKYNLPYKMDVNIEEILDTINLDKKKLGKSLNLIILKEIGNSEIYKTTTEFFI
ncbi:3-dehydroquinate synthase [Clostridium celatum]|uniref:3-dehydroquinate synthase n=3 Tax=Clostridium celatum TaxID=36834 RepID=UPI00189AC417|nr:3-dehydroquinate synthase [Clostridium celatum]MCE9654995.1 3-dehydroquinate synthase [Clostridium celatum]MDU2265969.1 3-dehydroquinate synthase [Clostridium celatum]MDU3724065.1 3-dehydroquinate synthase [Clostridium celatum]MDU6296289.1 3-dehydroquinate synthase [Clostridium celatum]MDY3361463.1 3-dehydroquinate synthase [Clostridium celatum]